MRDLFAHKVLSALREMGLIDDSVVAQIMSQTHSGFSAWMGEHIPPDDEGYRLFLSRYIDRGPVAESRIDIIDDIVTYRTEKDSLTHEFDPVEFLARISPHIPDKWEQTTRYFGYYSSRSRAKRKCSSDNSLILQDIPYKKASKSWAALIKRIYEVDPLVCPKCSGTMKIIAFVIDPREVKALLKNLHIPPWTKPTPIHSTAPPSPTLVSFFDDSHFKE